MRPMSVQPAALYRARRAVRSRRSRSAGGLAITLLVALIGGGCGDGSQAGDGTTRSTTTATAAPPATEATEATSPAVTDPATSTAPPAPDSDRVACRLAGGLRLRVVTGAVECAERRRVAGAYDLDGAAVQRVGAWMCQAGNVQTRPIVFTCSRGGRELVAEQDGG